MSHSIVFSVPYDPIGLMALTEYGNGNRCTYAALTIWSIVFLNIGDIYP
ncbi:hypothetical protein [Paenibacillus taiwanensis]|nr:hypothetical protein [Paenibacillus taiwanensis]